jgi:hypothetical protein
MKQDWDFYLCRVDDKPASIYLNLGLIQESPIAGMPFMAYVRVYMRAPRADGLSSQEEFDSLAAIEDSLDSQLSSRCQAIYVGRNTSDNCRDFYFYSPDDQQWEQSVAETMHLFPDYVYECGTRHDPAWDVYLNFLYPTQEDRERIENRRTCLALEKNGETFSKERPIEHWAYFPSAEARSLFIEKSRELGYSLQATFDPASAGEHYGVRVSCNGIPSPEHIDALTIPLLRIAQACGGHYDGWETQVLS